MICESECKAIQLPSLDEAFQYVKPSKKHKLDENGFESEADELLGIYCRRPLTSWSPSNEGSMARQTLQPASRSTLTRLTVNRHYILVLSDASKAIDAKHEG